MKGLTLLVSRGMDVKWLNEWKLFLQNVGFC